MQLLKFFLEWGKHGLGFLWVPYIILSAWLLIQAGIASRSGWYQNDNVSGYKEGKENIRFWKSRKFYGFLAITVAAIIIHFGIKYEWFD